MRLNLTGQEKTAVLEGLELALRVLSNDVGEVPASPHVRGVLEVLYERLSGRPYEHETYAAAVQRLTSRPFAILDDAR